MFDVAPIPGTTLKPGTPWLAMTRHLPEPRLAQDDAGPAVAPPSAGRIASVFSALGRSH